MHTSEVAILIIKENEDVLKKSYHIAFLSYGHQKNVQKIKFS